MRVGLVSTVRGLDASFFTWVEHHLRAGIARIYLVFDAPDEDRETIAALRRAHPERVRCVDNDAAHRARGAGLPGYESYAAQSERYVVARQRLNVGILMPEVRADGMDWLLHLDSDELIAPYTRALSLPDYLAGLSADIDEVIFPNFEALPEAERIEDPFREVTLFKRSPYYLRYKEFEQLFTAWDGASGRFKIFNAYITGKAALRLADVDEPFVPRSVHHFLPMRFTANVHIEDEGGPAIFHYPFCGLDRFLARFGGFNAERADTYDEKGFEDDLYGAARALTAAGRHEELPALYRRLVLLEEVRPKLERRGLLLRLSPLLA